MTRPADPRRPLRRARRKAKLAGQAHGTPDTQAIQLETLEQRLVLAADIASVGLVRDGSDWNVFASEVALDDDDLVTESSTVFGGNLGPTDPIAGPLVGVERLAGGRFDTTFEGDLVDNEDPDAFAGFDNETGGQFLAIDGYPNGFFAGLDTESSTDATTSLAIERFNQPASPALQGQWLVQMARVDVATDRVDILSGQGTFGGQFFVLVLTGAGAVSPFISSLEYSQFDENGGAASLDGFTRLYLNRDASVMLGVDLNQTDGSVWILSAVRTTAQFTAEDIAGDYRIAGLAPTPSLQSSLGDSDTVAPLYLELTAAGQFRMSSLFDDDRGDGPTLLAGDFAIEQSTLTLNDTDRGVEISFLIADNGSTLQATELRFEASGTEDRLFALGSLVTSALPPNPANPGPPQPPLGPISLTEVRLSDSGRPEAFEFDEGGRWRTVDLITRAGGVEPPPEEAAFAVESWIDPRDGVTYAAAAFPSAVLLYRRGEDDIWVARDLADETSGSPIVSGLTQFNDLEGDTYLAGLDAAGELVLYQSGAVFPQGPELVFSFRNLTTQELEPRGQAVPAFTGELISYVTTWNALTIAGLDANGDVFGVWSPPGSDAWNSSNLSDITGAEPLAGGLTAFLTDWGGINIAGLNDAGEIVVSWWVPSFGGEWRQANLTTAFDGPTLTANSITSFVAPWGALNVAGIDDDGELAVYWWAPGLTDWQTANLTASQPLTEPRPDAPLQTNVTEDGNLNIFGSSDRDDFVRVSWSPDQPVWALEDLSEAAVPG